MNFEKLKELARKMGGLLVMDGNTPEFIIMPYDKYEVSNVQEVPEVAEEQAMIEKLNSEINFSER